jgi:hypothetical protein
MKGKSFLRLILSVVSVLSVVRPSPAAEPPITVENVRVGLAEQPAAGLAKIGTWTPVRVDLKAGAGPFKGFLEVIVPDDDGTGTIARQPIEVPADNGLHTYTAYVRPGTRNPSFLVRARDERGRVRGKEVNEENAETADATQTVIGILGNPRGVDEILTLPGFAPGSNPANRMQESDFRVIRFRTEALPGRWYGYDAAEMIVLDTNDQNVLSALGGTRPKALREWVWNGGHLVVAVASNWQVVKDSFLKDLLPALPDGTRSITDPGALEAFAGSSRINGPINAAILNKVPGRGGQELVPTASNPLVVRGPYGFGRVTVVGLDVDQKPFADWAGKKDFWVKALDIRGRGGANQGLTTVPAGGGSFYQVNTSDLSSLLHLTLEKPPGVKLVPFGWVAFFIFLYILLIGPGDYLFLKKVLKRMELTWITFPAIVITVSLLAYVAAYTVKGTDLRINKVDALDIDQSGPSKEFAPARGTTWVTLFSPQNRDYGLTVAPLPLDRDPKDATPPDRLPAGTELLVSWFGGPDPVMGGNNRLGLSGAPYEYLPMGGDPEKVDGVRIAIWSTKSFAGRWSSPAVPPVVDADLRPVGTDRLAGTITNRLNRPLRDAWLAFGRQVYELGDLKPGATARVETVQNRVLASLLEQRVQAYQRGGALNYEANPQDKPVPRGDLVRGIMFREVMASKGGATQAGSTLHYLDLSGQLALDRPMLVASLDGQAAALVLDGAPSPPKIEHETILRVLLPLGEAEDAGGSKSGDK